LGTFSQEDRVDELIDLLPRVLPVMNSDKSTASAFQCLGKHGRHEAALSFLTLLKKSGKQSQKLFTHSLFSFISLFGTDTLFLAWITLDWMTGFLLSLVALRSRRLHSGANS